MSAQHPQTRAIHIEPPELGDSRPASVPIYQTSTFAFDDPDSLTDSLGSPDKSYGYSRYANPTVRALEDAVAELEGGAAGLAASSGMAAINAVLLGLLRSGDHVIAQRGLYGGTTAMLHTLADRFGVEVTFVSGRDAAEVSAAVRPTTRMLYLETIANPMTQVVDLASLAAAGREAGLSTVVDNTFASPALCRPLQHGADIVLHSATKYLGGHSDVIGGVAVFADPAQHAAVWRSAIELGGSADPFAAWLIIRGLQTLPLRMREHCANAGALAERLRAHPGVAAVHWPGLAEHPSHDVARRLLDGYGGVLSFDLPGGREAGSRLCSALRLVSLGASLGGVETLALHPATSSHRKLTGDELAAAGITAGTIRVSVGLEHPDDVWADLAQALDAVEAG